MILYFPLFNILPTAVSDLVADAYLCGEPMHEQGITSHSVIQMLPNTVAVLQHDRDRSFGEQYVYSCHVQRLLDRALLKL